MHFVMETQTGLNENHGISNYSIKPKFLGEILYTGYLMFALCPWGSNMQGNILRPYMYIQSTSITGENSFKDLFKWYS